MQNGEALGIGPASTSSVTRRRTGRAAPRLLPKALGRIQGRIHPISDPVPVPDAVEKLMMTLRAAEQIDPIIQARADEEECEKRHHQGFQAAGQVAVPGKLPKSAVELEIVLIETFKIAGFGGSLHGVHKALQHVEVGGRSVLHSQFHGQAFELLSDPEDLSWASSNVILVMKLPLFGIRVTSPARSSSKRASLTAVFPTPNCLASCNSTILSPGPRSPDVIACRITSTIRCLREAGSSTPGSMFYIRIPAGNEAHNT